MSHRTWIYHKCLGIFRWRQCWLCWWCWWQKEMSRFTMFDVLGRHLVKTRCSTNNNSSDRRLDKPGSASRGLPRIRESWHKLLARIPWMAWSKSCLDSSGAWIHLDSYGLSSYFCYFYGEFICCLKHCKSRDTWRCLDMMFKFVAQPFSHLMPLCFRDFWGAPSRGYFLGVFLMLGIGLLSLTRAVSLDLMKVLGFPFGRSTVWGIQRELFFDVFVTILGKSQFSVKSIVHVYFNIYIYISFGKLRFA